MKFSSLLLTLLLLSGCASIVSGTTQEVRVESSPPGASCNISRDGLQVQQVVTPASTIVQRTSRSLTVACVKPGYEQASSPAVSSVEPWIFGNILFGGVIGVVVDLSTGASNKYQSPVVVTLPASPPPSVTQLAPEPVG